MNGGIWAQIPELGPAGQVQAAGRRHHVGAHGGAVKAEQLSLQEKTIFLWTYLFADQIGMNQPKKSQERGVWTDGEDGEAWERNKLLHYSS